MAKYTKEIKQYINPLFSSGADRKTQPAENFVAALFRHDNKQLKPERELLIVSGWKPCVKYQRTASAKMYCPHCKVKMREEKRLFHKKRKWVCPRCGKVRMQVPKTGHGKGKTPPVE